MMRTKTALQTGNASKYLQQLCKHFGHKVPTDFDPKQGQITFPFGTCALSATNDALFMAGEADPAHISKLERILADHLARFAFREAPSLEWQRSTLSHGPQGGIQ